MKNRNIQLFKELLNGKSVLQLAKEFNLSDAGVRLIVKKIFDETLAAYPELKAKHTKKIPESERDVAIFNTKREFWAPYLDKLKTPAIWEGMPLREYPKIKRPKKPAGMMFTPEKMVKALARDAEIPVPVAGRIVSSVLDRMREELKIGHIVVLQGIGTMRVVSEEEDVSGTPTVRRRIKLTSYGAVEKALKAKDEAEAEVEYRAHETTTEPDEVSKPIEEETPEPVVSPTAQEPAKNLVKALTDLIKQYSQ